VQRTETDHEHLTRAIELAERGVGSVSPNPVVGAVVVKDDRVLGEGWHEEYGGSHAEVNAIASAGDADLQGATLYVSLEPCCHHGQQPPCTDAILAGGELAARARQQNQAFRKHARTGRPWVLFKSAMSLDGKVATKTGDSKWISSEDSRLVAHRWRASCDAVAVGIGTALADDPQLTARIDGVRHQPRRVVFDATGRLPLDSKLVSAAHEVPLVVVVSRAARRSNTDALENAGAEVIVATGENEPARVRSALDQLGALDPPVTSVLLEGGPHLAGAFLDGGEIDELRLFIAPLLLGGRSARDPLEGEGVDAISDALRALTLECHNVAGDVLLSARLREW
jgi:diaminohydroxyphosphoribosylaminopyrimidine deaminase / 5-amino-6-(5-phosphoribosylamino)uracil reductase